MPLRALLLLSLICTGAAGDATTPAKPRALTADLAWWNRQLVDQYRAVGERDRWDPAAERFLGLLAAHYRNAFPYAQDSELSTRGMAVLEDGCADPLMIVRTAMFYDGSDYGRTLINWAADLLHQRQGSPKAYGALHLVAAVRRQVSDPDPARAQRARAELPGLVRQALADGLRDEALRDAGRRVLADVLDVLVEPEAVGAETAQAMRTLFAEPAVDPWLGKVLLGTAEISLAWQARGNGWGKDVTSAGWEGFRQHLATARTLLSAAWKLRPDLARAPALMISVAMGDSIDQPQTWAERAWAADPEDFETYTRLANACLPRWGGSHEALLALAQRAAAGAWDGPLPGVAELLAAMYMNDAEDGRAAVNGRPAPAVLAKMWPVLSAATADQPGIPPAAAALRRTRRIAWSWFCERREEALAAFTAAGGLDAPWLDPGAVPVLGRRIASGPQLALELQRAKAGEGPIVPRALPTDLAANRLATRPAFATRLLLPDWYARHGTHGAWDAQAAVLMGPMLAHAWAGEGAADPAWPTPAAILATGCSDPLLACLAHDLAPDPDAARQRQLADADWQALAGSAYPALAAYQPAWMRLHRLPRDAAGKAERARLQEGYAAIVRLTAQQAGGRVPLIPSIHELIQIPDQDPGSLAALSEAAAQPGVDPLLADALRGCVEVRQSLGRARGDPERRCLAWRALARLWRTWDATHDPLIAAEMLLATGVTGCPVDEIRGWFSNALEGAMDRDEPWTNMVTAQAVNGRADELLIIASAISKLPASAPCHHRALPFLLSVVGNRSLHEPERMRRLWAIGDRVTTTLLSGKLSPGDTVLVLHQRAAYAFLAGRHDEARAALARLGKDFAANLLPEGIDIQAFRDTLMTAANPTPPEPAVEVPERPSDF